MRNWTKSKHFFLKNCKEYLICWIILSRKEIDFIMQINTIGFVENPIKKSPNKQSKGCLHKLISGDIVKPIFEVLEVCLLGL